MPYINTEDRAKYDEIIDLVCKIDTKGELEYIIMRFMNIYMSTRERKYNTLHDCVYACKHVSDEYRRRYLDKREDEALAKNGDIE